MDTLVNTAKIEMEAQIKQAKVGGGGQGAAFVRDSNDADKTLLDTVAQIDDAMREYQRSTTIKLKEEAKDRLDDMT